MSVKDYKKEIILRLLSKYDNRYVKKITTTRRIILKPTEIYKKYKINNADIDIKEGIKEATSILLNMGFIHVDYLKFSEDIERIYLEEDQLDNIYTYLKDEYGLIPRNMILKKVQDIVNQYIHIGEIVKKYCECILEQIKASRDILDPRKVEANCKMFKFLEYNEENVYIREASMIVYGDSKWFEDHNYEEVCTFLRNIYEEYERDDILSLFHVIPTPQEVFIKGNWKIVWEDHILDLSYFQGGIALTSSDLQTIQQIKVYADTVMTIENKTSYQRMKSKNKAMMYLGGFANRQQIDFIKKVIKDNPDVKYQHFGDIDIGGFLIHKHLCHETNQSFALYCMGIQQLCDARFVYCLKPLTENDMNRLETLIQDDDYRDILEYMKEHNVKLEQEIISYYL